ncbi:hypothetical protein [Endozoicomonas numazuensis]|nr:hypothetical protein [Endozoicomonas numazuensis]
MPDTEFFKQQGQALSSYSGFLTGQQCYMEVKYLMMGGLGS